ncbi:DUF423 domain-containing protein [Urechidicola vernalis]|uniref:DUF423 domain-containing protein n=1 Tax=Urechidicola vernalis TaxID=3075600 RepID=A0ABU2Y5P2_9FLAO|nr:DUF423 domain-containing protein [Urechidicola sp. P050]MDT0553519.1 DUF423 domain-containing protein [Urechidicola sp. P050]
MKNRNLIVTSILGMLTVVFGAFGVHSLKEILSHEALNSFETAVRYQMYHVIVLLLVNMYGNFSAKTKNNISLLFFIGILFFSGSIYAISMANIPAKSIWFITPLGGLILILGWIKLSISFFKDK